MTKFPKGFVGVSLSKIRRLAPVVAEHGQLLYRAGQQVQDILDGLHLPSTAGKTIARVGDEMMRKAPDLERRRRLAEIMDKEGNPFGNLADAYGGVTIREHDLGHLRKMEQAATDARTLHRLLADKNNQTEGDDISTSRKKLRALAQNVAQNTGDKSYLETFWALAGIDAVKVARFLSNQHHDHSILHSNTDKNKISLTSEDKEIVGAFGRSLAAASRQKVLPEDRWGDFTRPDGGDVWSANMLLRYGPQGDKWDPWLLAQWSRGTLDWWRSHPYKDADGNKIFFEGRGEEFEYSLAALRRLGENRNAARMVVGDRKTGYTYARDLANPEWAGFGGAPGTWGYNRSVDYSKYAGQVFRAAAYQHRGTSPDSELATRAVANMVRATNSNHAPGFSKGEPALPPDLRHALTDVASAYIPDFAESADKGNVSSGDPRIRHKGDLSSNPWIVQLSGSQMTSFLNEILADPKDLGRYQGAVAAQVAPAVGQSIAAHKAKDGSLYLSQLSNLMDLIAFVRDDRGLTKAEKADANAEANQRLFDAIAGGFGNTPFGGPAKHLGYAQVVSGLLQPSMDSAFDTKHVERTQEANKAAQEELWRNMYIPVVQGLIDAGYLRPPRGAHWFKNGRVVPGDPGLHTWFHSREAKNVAGKDLYDWVTMARQGIRK